MDQIHVSTILKVASIFESVSYCILCTRTEQRHTLIKLPMPKWLTGTVRNFEIAPELPKPQPDNFRLVDDLP